MPNKRFLIRATLVGACLALAPSVFAQSRKSPADEIRWTGPPAPPACVYRAVMTDAEIQACTGRPVRYDYRVMNEGTIAATR